jgi:hypothetical protein
MIIVPQSHLTLCGLKMEEAQISQIVDLAALKWIMVNAVLGIGRHAVGRGDFLSGFTSFVKPK